MAGLASYLNSLAPCSIQSLYDAYVLGSHIPTTLASSDIRNCLRIDADHSVFRDFNHTLPIYVLSRQRCCDQDMASLSSLMTVGQDRPPGTLEALKLTNSAFTDNVGSCGDGPQRMCSRARKSTRSPASVLLRSCICAVLASRSQRRTDRPRAPRIDGFVSCNRSRKMAAELKVGEQRGMESSLRSEAHRMR